MTFSFAQIIPWLEHYKYFAIFPLAFIEGPIITIIAGFLSSLGYINIFFAYLVIIAGDLTSDFLYYFLGNKGGIKFVGKWGRYLGIAEQHVESLEKYFDKHGGKMLFLGKISHGIGTAFLVAAGLAKMPFIKFLFYNSLATFLKSFALILIGFYFGYAFATINSYLEKIAVLSVAITITFLIAYLLYFYKKKGND